MKTLLRAALTGVIAAGLALLPATADATPPRGVTGTILAQHTVGGVLREITVAPGGSTLVEPSGADHVHIGRNLGTAPMVLEVLYVNPAGSPLSQDAPNPGCAFE